LSLTEEDLNVFTQLGMTPRQVEVYVTINEIGQSTAKTIAKTAQIARAEVYRVIPELEKLGLITRIISNPISFRAVPLSKGLSILLSKETEKYREIKGKAKQFSRKFKKYTGEKLNQEDTQYYLTSGLKAEEREFLRELKEIQISKDGIFNWRLILFAAGRYFEENKEALERGVKIRNITHIPEGEKIPQSIRTLIKTGSFKIKYIQTIPKAGIDILDKKCVHVIIVPGSNMKEIEVLRSRNPAIIELAQDYFELKWQEARTLS
jgi:sugar-specific transcriptional regulator TrmB